ncbi:MAG: helix-turn-helix domain-containing protein [Planctomycetia bacterium]
MPGRYLSIEEAAERLGGTIDEVHRLVDQRKLYPVRDGATLKFKDDDLSRYLAEREDSLSIPDDEAVPPVIADAADSLPAAGVEGPDLELDIDDSLTLNVELGVEPANLSAREVTPAPVVAPVDAADKADSLVLGEPSGLAGSDVIELADEAPAVGGSALSLSISHSSIESPKVNGIDSAAQLALGVSGPMTLDRDDLEIDSIIGASAVAPQASPEPAAEGTLEIDLGEPLIPDGSGASLAIGVGSDLAAGARRKSGKVGSALSDVLDSGVLIEEKPVEIEGVVAWDEVDLGIEEKADEEEEPAGVLASGLDADVGGLGDDDDRFDLGTGEGDDDNASVLNPTDESGDSSLFQTGDESSAFSGPSFSMGDAGSESFGIPGGFIQVTGF